MVRSPSAPASLERQTSWGGDDVRDQLRSDFDGQCYLCEGMLDRSWQVEHLRPRAAFPDLAHAWPNLYPACAICNNLRKKLGNRGVLIDGVHKPWPVGGMLDPTGNDDIAGRLHQWLEVGVGVDDTHVHFEAVKPDDVPATNTAEELRHIHEGQEDARLLRDWLRGRWVRVLERALAILVAKEAERTRLLAEARVLIGPSAPYGTLMRERVRRLLKDKPKLRAELGL